MKKRLLLFVGFLIILLGGLFYLIDWKYYRTPAIQEKFPSFLPPEPLVYIQCPHLNAQAKHAIAHPEFHAIVQSDFMKHVQQTSWWPEFREQFDQFWHSIIIDPMRIIGTDMALAVYPSDIGEILPRAILIGRVDRIARIAERLTYLFDKATGQIGMVFGQEYQGVKIYILQTPDMVFPLYYAIVGNIGQISTSLPLLKDSLLSLLEKTKASPSKSSALLMMPSPFKKAMQEVPEQYVMAGFCDLPRLVKEFRQNFFLRQTGWFQGREWEKVETFPFITLTMQTTKERLLVRSNWVAEFSDIKQTMQKFAELLEPGMAAKISSDEPLIMTRYKRSFTQFIQTWQHFFPQWLWEFPGLDQSQNIYGDLMECRMSAELLGILYAIPDVSCMVETQNVGRSKEFLEMMIQNILRDQLPPIIQQGVNITEEPYRDTQISKIQFMFQNMLNYAVESHGDPEGTGQTIVSTNPTAVKQRLDILARDPDQHPYVLLPSSSSETAFVGFLNNQVFSEFLHKASRSNTFFLVFPRYSYEQFYALLPYLIQALETLPPMVIKGGTSDAGIYLEFQAHYSSSFNE